MNSEVVGTLLSICLKMQRNNQSHSGKYGPVFFLVFQLKNSGLLHDFIYLHAMNCICSTMPRGI